MPVELHIKGYGTLVVEGGLEFAKTLVDGNQESVVVTAARTGRPWVVQTKLILVAEVVSEDGYRKAEERKQAWNRDMDQYVKDVGRID